ncbi:MAG TPA: tryptophan synthase subunit alpha [Coprothermobacter sp.]|nr:tryptophan synthase subunit alpha [Coprothermobacter sp.]
METKEDHAMENKNTRLQKTFEEMQREDRKALIAYITAGYPDLQSLSDIVQALEKGGADMVQVGIPFLDPVGDAPIVQVLSKRAVENGFTVEKFFQALKELRMSTTLPLLLRAYYTTIFGYGEDRFVEGCKEASIDGVVVPDLPLEENGALKSKLDTIDVPLIPIVVPAPMERIKAIVESGGGFVYLMMAPGENQRAFVDQLNDFANQIKQITKLPVCLGIELRELAFAKQLINNADSVDGILIGDVLMGTLQKACDNKNPGQLPTEELTQVVEYFSTSMVPRR